MHKKNFYPAVFTPMEEGGYLVYVPDLEINTSGEDLPDAIYMARDAISLLCITLEDDKKPLPEPSVDLCADDPNALISYVDFDLEDYRRKLERRTVRRNVSLPLWIDKAAKEAGINVSSVLVNALKAELHLSDR